MRHGLKPVYVGSYCPDSAFLDGDLDVIRVVEVVTTNPTPSERHSSLIKRSVKRRVEATQVPVRKESKWRRRCLLGFHPRFIGRENIGDVPQTGPPGVCWTTSKMEVQRGNGRLGSILRREGELEFLYPIGKGNPKRGSTGLTNVPKGRTSPTPERIQPKDVPTY